MKLTEVLRENSTDLFRTLVARINEMAPRESSHVRRAPGAEKKGRQADGTRKTVKPFRKYELPNGKSSEEYYKCVTCGECRPVNNFAQDHQEVHKGKKFEVRWYCPLCKTDYAVTHRSYHIMKRHGGVKNGKKRPSRESEEDGEGNQYTSPEHCTVTVPDSVLHSHVPAASCMTQGQVIQMGEEVLYPDMTEGGNGYALPSKRQHLSEEISSPGPSTVPPPFLASLPTNGPSALRSFPVGDAGLQPSKLFGSNGSDSDTMPVGLKSEFKPSLNPGMVCCNGIAHHGGIGTRRTLFPGSEATMEKLIQRR